MAINVGTMLVSAVNPDGSVIGSAASATQPVSITGQPLTTYGVANPAIINSFVYSQAEQPGVVAANNFMSVFNPVGSGKILMFGGAFISSYIVGDTAATIESLRGFRITAASGGTLVPNATVCSFDTTKPDTTMEVRTGNPTVTLGDAIFNSPPFIGAAKQSIPFVHQVPVPAGLGGFLFRPGEGIVLRTAAGDVDTRWNLSLAWSEM